MCDIIDCDTHHGLYAVYYNGWFDIMIAYAVKREFMIHETQNLQKN